MSSYLTIPPELQALALSFLPFPEAVLPVSHSMKEGVQIALHQWTRPSSNPSELNAIRESFARRFGVLNIEDYRAIDRRVKSIRIVAAHVTRENASLLFPQEWAAAGSNLNQFSKSKQFDQMVGMIQDRKDENLILFFKDVCAQSKEAKLFLDHLSQQSLSSSEMADKIQQWLTDNSKLLDKIEKINMEMFSQNECEIKNIIPVEVLKLRNLNENIIYEILISAFMNRRNDLTLSVLLHNRFNKISDYHLNFVLNAGVNYGHPLGVKALLGCLKFEIDCFFKQAVVRGNLDMVNAFIGSSRFDSVSPEKLGETLLKSAKLGHFPIIQALLGCSRFREIPLEYLNDTFLDATSRGHHLIVKALIGCKRFKEISAKILGSALLTGLKESNASHLEIVNALLSCRRRGEILAAAETIVQS